MERLLIVAVVLVVALAVALMARRRTGSPVRTGYDVPDQLDRADFDRPDAPWLVAVFTSRTCASCGETLEKAKPLISDDVAVQEIERDADRALHDRYAIEAVPMIVVVDDRGVRRASFLGPPRTDELWAALADLQR